MIPLLIAALLLTPQARAEDAAAKPQSAVSDARKWLEHLREGLAESAVKKQRRRMSGVAAVAAVRGAEQKQEDPNKPYFKGGSSAKEDKQVKAESAELKKAVDAALAGRRDEAGKLLDAFEAAHPKSALAGDCREAKKRLATLPADAPAADAKPAEPKGSSDAKPAAEPKPAEGRAN